MTLHRQATRRRRLNEMAVFIFIFFVLARCWMQGVREVFLTIWVGGKAVQAHLAKNVIPLVWRNGKVRSSRSEESSCGTVHLRDPQCPEPGFAFALVK